VGKRLVLLLAGAMEAGCFGGPAPEEGTDPQAADVRIEKVACYEITGERTSLVAPNAYSNARPRRVSELVIVISTNRRDLSGFGVTGSAQPPREAYELIGMNPLEIFRIEGSRIVGLAEAHADLAYRLRGLDLAVLDLVGKLMRRPVAGLWGSVHRISVEAYDSSLYFEDLLRDDEIEDYPFQADPPVERVGRKAKWVVEKRGINVLKIKVGRSGRMGGARDGVAADIAAVRAVRRAVGSAPRLIVDGNNGYSGHLDWVLEFARGVAECGVFAMEEMIPEEVEAYKALRENLRRESIQMLIADGESLKDFSPAWVQSFLSSRLVDIVQPDLVRNGILGVRRWAEAAAGHGARLVSHNFGTKMGVYGAVHVALSVPNSDLVETDDSEFPGLDAPGFEIKDGRYQLTGRHGLGVHLAGSTLRRLREVWTVTEPIKR
jgi:L-alanine-DL-glutamate epimerase-like enolase superfamily enzyme